MSMNRDFFIYITIFVPAMNDVKLRNFWKEKWLAMNYPAG